MVLMPDGSVWSTGITLSDGASSRGVGKYFLKVIESDAIAVAAGYAHGIVLKQDGSVWATGRNYRGQLGTGTQERVDTFVCVKMLIGVKATAAGSRHSMLMTQQGEVWVTVGTNMASLA